MRLLRRDNAWPARHPAGGRLPNLPGPVGAAAVGLLCAVLAMLLVALGERGCDAVLGTPSCGGAGVVLLAVVAAAMLSVGLVLLRLLDAPDPGITNLFGFSLFVIVLMSALLEQIFSTTMWIVLPLLGAACYSVAALLSTGLARISDSS